jgi:hypothetical protein
MRQDWQSPCPDLFSSWISLDQASEALTRHAYREVARQFLFVPVRGRDDCAFRPSRCQFLIKERADRLRAAKLGLRNVDISGCNSDCRNEAAMRVDNLAHKAGLTQGDASTAWPNVAIGQRPVPLARCRCLLDLASKWMGPRPRHRSARSPPHRRRDALPDVW